MTDTPTFGHAAETKAPAAETPGVVWLALSGPNLEPAAYVVCERGNPNRIIAAAPFVTGDDPEPDPAVCLAACKLVAQDPNQAGPNPDVFDYRRFGRLDSASDDEMPQDVYGWELVDPAHPEQYEKTIKIFPFCRHRIAQMLGFWATVDAIP